MDAIETDADKHGVKLTAKRKTLLQSELCDTREDAVPVLKKVVRATGRSPRQRGVDGMKLRPYPEYKDSGCQSNPEKLDAL